MPVPTSITDLSQTAGSNSPPGSESPTTADDYFRAHASFIALLRDGKGFSDELDVASAGTTDIGAVNSSIVRITGTTTITSLGTTYNGPRFVRFADALTLTYNASTLVLPGAANITTAAGDAMLCVPNGSTPSGWRVLFYTRAASVPVSFPLATTLGGTGSNYADAAALFAGIKQAATTAASGVVELATSTEFNTGTDTGRVPAVDVIRDNQIVLDTPTTFSTQTSIDSGAIPSWAKRIHVILQGLSTTGTSLPIIQLSDAGGPENSGYLGAVSTVSGTGSNSVAHSTGFALAQAVAAATIMHGTVTLTRIDSSGTTWTISGNLANSNAAATQLIGGSKTLTGQLTGVRLTTVNGTDQFDNTGSGQVNFMWE